jgi:enoyl-CoA hydratase/carnithine racemase
VLTGTGRAFCAGRDIAELNSYPTPWQFGQREDYGDVLRTLRKRRFRGSVSNSG